MDKARLEERTREWIGKEAPWQVHVASWPLGTERLGVKGVNVAQLVFERGNVRVHKLFATGVN